MDMDMPPLSPDAAPAEAPARIKLVCRVEQDAYRVYFSANGREWQLPESPQEQLALRLLDAHDPEARLREVAAASADGCAVLVFRTDTRQMEEFGDLLGSLDEGDDDTSRPAD